MQLPVNMDSNILNISFKHSNYFQFKDGKSVMVEVATGGDTGEQLPMVLKVPHLSSTIEFARACGVPYSMLGFGDILVPGLLLSYCHSFDILVGTPCKVYWIITNIGKKQKSLISFQVWTILARCQKIVKRLI